MSFENDERVEEEKKLNDFLNTYKQVILWGASYLGREIGEYLIKNSIDFGYWDLRADEIGIVNGRKVERPFQYSEYLPKDVVVILCIGNTAIRGSLLKQLRENGNPYVVLGDDIYQKILCPFNAETGINGEVCNTTMHCRSMFCDRLHGIIRQQYDKGGIFIPNLTIMITSHCSLKCKYCCAYMNSYPLERRFHIPVERICEDIDIIFNQVDSIGSITVQGGEPFLHPQIDVILKKILSKQNFGIVSVATNGIFSIDESKLNGLQDARLNVAFSGYYDALPQEKLDIYYHNIEKMKKNHVYHTVGVKVPEWSIPPTLSDKGLSIDEMKRKLSNCRIPMRCIQMMNGCLYPCLYSLSLHAIGVADYSIDYISLEADNVKERIIEWMNQEYYQSCSHCVSNGDVTGMAGEQGYYDFVNT